MKQYFITYGEVYILTFMTIFSSVMGIYLDTKMNNRQYLYKHIVVLTLSMGLIIASAIDYITGINILGPYFAMCVIVVLTLNIAITIRKCRSRKNR